VFSPELEDEEDEEEQALSSLKDELAAAVQKENEQLGETE
jgi:hypothetical protein